MCVRTARDPATAENRTKLSSPDELVCNLSAKSDGGRGLMLDARRTALQVPLMREVTALQRIRTLQDPGTSSSVTSAGSSGTGKKTKKGKTFLGDPHRDAQALAIELSGKLANSAHAPSLSDHARPPNPQRRGKHGHARVAKPRTMKSTIPGEAKLSDPATSPIKVDVRERIKRIESAFERSTTTVSGELRKEGLLRELKARGRDDDELVRSDDRWDGGMARREELARKIIDEQRGSSVSSLAQLLGNHYGSGRSALDLLGVVADEEHFGDEILFQSDEEDEPPPPLSSRGHDALAKPRAGRARARKRPASARLREPSRGKPSAQRRDPPPVLLDAVSSLPHGCGIPWDWSRLTSKRHEAEHLSPPVQSISSLDSDANALPLIIGEDAHDSDPAGYYIEPSRCHAAAARPRQAPSLQSAVKDVPEDVADAPAPRTLSQKYRPKNFREIVGQAVVVRALSAAIVRARVAPVYLFMGPRGTGKTSTARVFAAGLNCLSPDSRPCGTCRECRTMSNDVREIDAASTTDLTSMRVAMGSFAPQARFKVFIVEGCDCLTPDIWNAFLKVLEEPPRNVVFILITTDADRIPVTATSRCQKFPFAKLKPPDIITRLELLAAKESLVVEPGAFPLIASRSDGSLRDAETILDQLCLLDKHISLALVQELVGVLPDDQVLDLLDYALSANTVHTVRTLREVLAAGVEPLALVSQLGGLITDILVGALEVDRDARTIGFFTRNLSAKEEQQRLRLALKILSDAEKQLRVAADRGTWLTAALLQFAPDRSFLPSEVNTTPSPVAAVTYPVYGHDPSEPEPAYAESKKHPTPDPEENVATFSEQKLEEAWAGEPPPQQDDDVNSESTPRAPVELQVFEDTALAELWKRVVWEVTPRNLKNLLQTHGRLVAAGVAIDGSCAVVELEFDYARDKHKAERSWRSICIAFQAVLSTAVELRIALSDMAPDADARIGETMVDMEASPSAQPAQSTEIQGPEPAAASRPRHRRRGQHRSRKHRHAAEFVSSSDPSGVTPRRPPNRRRRVKRAGAGKAAAKPVVEMEAATHEAFTREVWDSISVDPKPQERKPLGTLMEEPLSDIEDLQSAQKKIMKQRTHVQLRNDTSLTLMQQSALVADLQRGLPKESVLCWRRPSPQSDFLMRKSRVKSVKKVQGKAMLLRLVPCRDAGVTQNDAPAATAPVIAAA